MEAAQRISREESERRIIEARDAIESSGLGEMSDEVSDETMARDWQIDGDALAAYIADEIVPKATARMVHEIAKGEVSPSLMLGVEWMDGFVTGAIYSRLLTESEKRE